MKFIVARMPVSKNDIKTMIVLFRGPGSFLKKQKSECSESGVPSSFRVFVESLAVTVTEMLFWTRLKVR